MNLADGGYSAEENEEAIHYGRGFEEYRNNLLGGAQGATEAGVILRTESLQTRSEGDDRGRKPTRSTDATAREEAVQGVSAGSRPR